MTAIVTGAVGVEMTPTLTTFDTCPSGLAAVTASAVVPSGTDAVAVSIAEETKAMVAAVPFSLTTDPATKPDPFTVRATVPAVTDAGEILEITGAGLTTTIGALTMSETALVCTIVPLVARTDSMYVFGCVADVVLTDSVVFPDVVTAPGENVEVAPAGNPLTSKETVPAKPFKGATVTPKLACTPAVTVCETEARDRVNVGVGLTTSATTLWWEAVGFVAVIVSG